MKKTMLTLGALCVVATAFAQTTFGIKAGADLSGEATKIGGSKITSNAIIGIAGGIYADLPVAPEFYIQPSLMYEGKGGTRDLGSGYKAKTRLNYLTLPVDLLFKAGMPDGSGAWMIGVGPYLGYGLSGKVSGGPDISQYSGDPFKENEGSLKRFDAGANVQLGYETAAGFNIGLSAELGLMNIAEHGDSKNSVRNTSAAVLIGYTFGK